METTGQTAATSTAVTPATAGVATRLRFVDIAKGIAIICIILGHLGIWSINRIVFTFHVPIFYFITGYFISRKRSIPEFTKNKARTLLVPYYLACIVVIVLATLKGALHGEALQSFLEWAYAALYAAGDSYTDPFFIKGIGAIWFLWATFWGSLFLRLTLELRPAPRIAAVAVLFAFGYLSREVCWLPLSIQAGACATLFMYMGYALHEKQELLQSVPNEAKWIGALCALVVWGFFIRDFQSFWLVHCDVGRGPIDIFGCICACSIVMLVSYGIDKKAAPVAKTLSTIGEISLLVLCVHIVELDLFPWWSVVQSIGIPPEWQLAAVIAGKLVLDIGGAWVLSKIPIVRKAFGYRA